MGLIYTLGKPLGRFCFGSFGRLELTGQEGVPPYGPLIVVANHVSFNDPPVLVAAIGRTLNFMGKRELFANPIGRLILPHFNVFPFDRSSLALDMVKLVLRLLAEDQVVVLFPEGHRSPEHALQKGLPGAAYIAMKSQATLLPVGIAGTEKFPPWRMIFPLCRLRVNIGQPFTLPVLEGRVSQSILQSLTDIIMYRIAALLPEEYRGVYATPAYGQPDDPAIAAGPVGAGDKAATL